MKKTLLAVIAVLSALPFISNAQYLPLTAGTSYPLTGTLITNVYNANQVALNNNGNNYGFISNPSPNKWSLGYGTTPSTLATSVLTWNDSGNIGIGTTSPSAKLDVDGSQRLNGDLSFAGDQTAYFIKGPGNGGAIRIRSNIGAAVDRNIQFGNVNNNGSWSSYMIVDQSGNVGIGTTNPDQLLSVRGVIHSQAVKVDMTGWSDYVFKPAYQLPSLASVKAYIDKNQHLPEIPSEQEIIKNGLDLSEMNKLLLKKVEELTLYLIEKDRKGQQQDKRIAKLEKQVKALTAH